MGFRIIFKGEGRIIMNEKEEEEKKNQKYADFYGKEAAQWMAKIRSDIKKYGRKQ